MKLSEKAKRPFSAYKPLIAFRWSVSRGRGGERSDLVPERRFCAGHLSSRRNNTHSLADNYDYV